jgi:hypothetical protein
LITQVLPLEIHMVARVLRAISSGEDILDALEILLVETWLVRWVGVLCPERALSERTEDWAGTSARDDILLLEA